MYVFIGIIPCGEWACAWGCGVPVFVGRCGVCGMLGGDLRCWWWDIPGGDCLLCSRGLSVAIPTVCVNGEVFPIGILC